MWFSLSLFLALSNKIFNGAWNAAKRKKVRRNVKKRHSEKHGINQNCRGTVNKFRCNKKLGKEEWIREFFRRKLFILIFYLYSIYLKTSSMISSYNTVSGYLLTLIHLLGAKNYRYFFDASFILPNRTNWTKIKINSKRVT